MTTYGVKINKRVMEDILNQIFNLEDEKEQESILWEISINSRSADRKFKNFEDLKVNMKDLKKMIERESVFTGKLGIALCRMLSIELNEVMIFEDSNKIGRVIKMSDRMNEKTIDFIPLTDSEAPIDDKIKNFNKMAEKYDAIDGRYFEELYEM